LRPSCKICKRKTDKVYREENLEKVKKIDLEYRKKHRKEANKRANKWYNDNRDYAIKYRRIHYKENWNQYKKNRARWNSEHPEFMKEYFKDYHRIRKSKDPNYAIRCSIRNRFKSAIFGGKEFTEYFEHLADCKMDFVKKWLESNFEPGFTWGNHGLIWHIDHITPVSYYDLTDKDQLLFCFHWSNIRPCTKEENLKKSNKIIPELIEEYKIKALLFHLKSSVPPIE
jgi:hypothetical protein